jgi:hypothetical protein
MWLSNKFPNSRVREHLKCEGYSRRCQRGYSKTGPHSVRAIFPGPHLSAPARKALPASPAHGQRGTVPETRPGPIAAQEPAPLMGPTTRSTRPGRPCTHGMRPANAHAMARRENSNSRVSGMSPTEGGGYLERSFMRGSAFLCISECPRCALHL